jgi:4-amino-4-deoxy-L-arabinose transferase-like glycosyltransferase
MNTLHHRRLYLYALLAGFVFRIFFIAHFPVIDDDDTDLYAEIAKTWLDHGTYGQMEDGIPKPTYTRLPGYPAFLAAVFFVFGDGQYFPVLLIQTLFDLGSCLLIAALALAMFGEGAALTALWISVLCPFTANYAAVALTETLSIFFTALALWSAVKGSLVFEEIRNWGTKWWLLCGFGIAGATLFRPDGIMLLMVLCALLGWQLVRSQHKTRILLAGAMTAVVVTGILAPWAWRNWLVFQEFQPLAPRYTNDPGEYVAIGFNQWFKTWPVDFASLYDIFWKVTSETPNTVDLNEIPPQASDSPAEREQLLALFTAYNEKQLLTPELDDRFAELARQRIAQHPLQYYLSLPALRIANMWFRPRTEQLGLEQHWWRFNPLSHSLFSIGYTLLNFLLVVTAVLGMARFRHAPGAGFLIGFVAFRSAFLGTLENPEPRYVLECFPVILVFAGAQIHAVWQKHSSKSHPGVPSPTG